MERYVLMAAAEQDRIGLRTYIDSWLRGRGAEPSTNLRFFNSPTGTVFLRVEFTASQEAAELRADFRQASAQWSLETWTIEPLTRPRMLVLAGREDHCLYELLSRNSRSDELEGDVVAVASNHEDLRGLTEAHSVPFTHIPWPDRDRDSAGTAAAHETLKLLIKKTKAELVVLARFMRILDGDVCDSVDVLNLHHGDVAAFPGANPYRQALERGVKGIAATAHYATGDLDQGPIIYQHWANIDHLGPSPSVAALRRAGRANEVHVLMTAIEWHCLRQVMVYRGGTVHISR